MRLGSFMSLREEGRTEIGMDARPVESVCRSNPSWRRDGTVSLGPAVAVELPHVPHFFDLVQVQIGHHHFVLVAAAHSAHLSPRIAEIGLAIELADGPGFLDADAIDCANKVLVGYGMGGLFEPPEIFAQAGNRSRRIEDDFRAIQPQATRPVGEMAVVADINPDLAHCGVENRVAQVAGTEIELLPKPRGAVGDVALAILAEVFPVRVYDGGGVVVDAGAFDFID